ncbi:MAG TPA: PspC domain-containing protein [Bryobacteraceae bacterium]|jgi:phage shock protein C|nr:PspC domain-containing protein [Bryobacteraceae bacterium]
MFCTRCGTQLSDSARFCTACGNPVGAAGPTAGPAPAPRRLRRIQSEKKIAGVCAGFAEYFDTDLTLMRVIWVALLILPPNLGAIAYIVAWAVMPKS